MRKSTSNITNTLASVAGITAAILVLPKSRESFAVVVALLASVSQLPRLLAFSDNFQARRPLPLLLQDLSLVSLVTAYGLVLFAAPISVFVVFASLLLSGGLHTFQLAHAIEPEQSGGRWLLDPLKALALIACAWLFVLLVRDDTILTSRQIQLDSTWLLHLVAIMCVLSLVEQFACFKLAKKRANQDIQ